MSKLQEYVVGALTRSKEFGEGVSALISGKDLRVHRLSGSALSLFVAALARQSARPVCLIASHGERAEQVYDDLEFFGLGNVCHFAEDETLPYEPDEPSLDILAKQIETYVRLSRLNMASQSAEPLVAVTSLESALKKAISAEVFNEYIVNIEYNDAVNIDNTAAELAGAGYIRVPIVEAPGEFAIRGGIVDVFPLNSDLPVRLDLFGAQIESIRYFDPTSQRSLKKEPPRSIALPPAKKNVLIQECLKRGQRLVPLQSLFPAGTIFVLDEPERFEARANEFWDLILRQHAERAKNGEPVPEPGVLFQTLDDLDRSIRGRRPLVEHHPIAVEGPSQSGSHRLAFHTAVFDGLQPHFKTFLGVIREHLDRDRLVVIACDNDARSSASRNSSASGTSTVSQFPRTTNRRALSIRQSRRNPAARLS
jgi:hypothetical protein